MEPRSAPKQTWLWLRSLTRKRCFFSRRLNTEGKQANNKLIAHNPTKAATRTPTYLDNAWMPTKTIPQREPFDLR